MEASNEVIKIVERKEVAAALEVSLKEMMQQIKETELSIKSVE